MPSPVLDPSTCYGRGCAGHRCRQSCAADVQCVVGFHLVLSPAYNGGVLWTWGCRCLPGRHRWRVVTRKDTHTRLEIRSILFESIAFIPASPLSIFPKDSILFLWIFYLVFNMAQNLKHPCKKSTTIENLMCATRTRFFIMREKTRCQRDLVRYVSSMRGSRFIIFHSVIGGTFSAVSASITFWSRWHFWDLAR